MLTIYITRHGQDEDNSKGILNGHRNKPLTLKGLDQAKTLSKKIENLKLKFEKIYSSPLQRAHKTAMIIQKTLDNPQVEVLNDLIERDFGVMTGRPVNSILKECSPQIIKTDIITYFLNPEGAETFEDLMNRARNLLRHLNAIHTDGNVLLVTHGDIGKMIFAEYYKLEWRLVLEMFHFGNSDLIKLSSGTNPEESLLFKNKQYNQ